MSDNLHRHLDNPLYKQALAFWRAIQQRQIKKGAAKYPEPLGYYNWKPLELINHAVEENVDQMHYLTALKQNTNDMENAIQFLLRNIEKEENHIDWRTVESLKEKYKYLLERL